MLDQWRRLESKIVVDFNIYIDMWISTFRQCISLSCSGFQYLGMWISRISIFRRTVGCLSHCRKVMSVAPKCSELSVGLPHVYTKDPLPPICPYVMVCSLAQTYRCDNWYVNFNNCLTFGEGRPSPAVPSVKIQSLWHMNV